MRGPVRQFFETAVLSETDECIIWPFAATRPSKGGHGYGHLQIEGKHIKVHALALERRVGPRPSPKHFAAHLPVTCHDTLCFNYRHLRWALQSENEADKHLDGTKPRKKISA